MTSSSTLSADSGRTHRGRRAAAAGLVALSAAMASAALAPSAYAGSIPPPSRLAGYGVTGTNVHKVVATWTQPAVTCGRGHTAAGFSARLTKAHGRQAVVLGTAAECVGGKAQYYAAFMGPEWVRIHHAVVKPGDVIKVSISGISSGVSYSIEDDTQGWGMAGGGVTGHRAKFTRAVVGATAKPVAGRGLLALADFGTAQFSGVKVDGKRIGDLSPHRIVMRSQKGIVQATPANLKGTGFNVTWQHR